MQAIYGNLARKKWVLPAVIMLVAVGIYTWISVSYLGNRLPISPDESQALFFAHNLAEHHTLAYRNPLDQKFTPHIFSSRQTVQNGGQTYPSAFLGYIILLGFIEMFNSNLIFLAGPLIALLCLLFTYLITKEIFKGKAALISLLTLATFPVFIYWMGSYYNDLAELAFDLGALYYLIKVIRYSKYADYLLLGIFMAVSIWMRYTNIILLPIAFLPVILLNIKRLRVKGSIMTILVLTVTMLPLLALNSTFYGSPLTFGQSSKDQLVYAVSNPAIPNQLVPLVPFRGLSILAYNTAAYTYKFVPLLIVLAAIGVVEAYIRKKTIKSILSTLVFVGVIWICYYAGGVYFGYGGDPVLISSYTRYLLLVYALLIIFASYFVGIRKSKWLKATLIITLLVANISLDFSSQNSLAGLKSQSQSEKNWLANVEEVTPANSVIFVKGADKILFPYRETALYELLSENGQGKKKGVEATTQLMRKLINANYPVYLLQEDSFYTGQPVAAYINNLPSAGLRVTSFDSQLGLYRIGRQK